MSIIEVVISVCLLESPGICTQKSLSYEALRGTTTAGCMMRSQPYVAQWSAANPQWRIERWRCGFADERERGA